MTLLILGLVLWVAAHGFKRVLPGVRAGLGDKGKGLVAIALVASVVLMVVGYRAAEVIPVYNPMPGMGHANNALMLIAIYLYAVGGTKGVLYPVMRHPMLWGTVVWAGAHLLVNGDLAAIILFGGIGLWALVTIAVINRAQSWTPPTNGRGIKGDAMALVGSVLLYAVIAFVHQWLGYSVFLGTYS